MASDTTDQTVSDANKLDGASKYASWKFCVKNILMDREMQNIVIGTQTRPLANRDKQRIWDKKAVKAEVLINMFVKEHICSLISKLDSALEAWRMLKDAYTRPNTSQALMLQNKLHTTK